MAFAVAERARHPLDPPKVGAILSTLAQASHMLRTGQLLHPASTQGSLPTPEVSLPGTRASPWTGLSPAGCHQLVDWLCHGKPPATAPALLGALREDRLLPHVDAWLCELFTAERIEATATEIVNADSLSHREDPEITRARATLADCERKLSKHLDGLEAGIPADVIAARIAATQREKSAAESVLAIASPAPQPLRLDQVVETLTALRELPELLDRIEQADRAELYQALGLTVRYRRIGTTEEVKLTSTLQSVDLKRVGGSDSSGNSQLTGPKGVDLKRVGGGRGNNALRPFDASSAWGSPHVGARIQGNPVREVGTAELWLPAA
jgi:hypothetical protein